MNVVTVHTDEITQVKVPLPFPLRWVNAYLIRGSRGVHRDRSGAAYPGG